MPEGPEIRRSAMRLAEVLDGQVARDVFFEQRPLRSFEALLTGARVQLATSRGKAILIEFDNELSIYSHNQLYGRWYVMAGDKKPRTRRTLRLAIRTDTHSALLYSASDIAVLDPEGVAKHPYLSRLGPDALDDSVVWRDIATRLCKQEFRNRSLGALYLDQGFVAGIGNYLRTEILFDAALSPRRKPADLSRAEIGRLARATLDITRRSLTTRGITNRPGRVRALRREGATRRDYRFAIFGRARRPCPSCGASIQRIEMTSRRLYICRTCQDT